MTITCFFPVPVSLDTHPVNVTVNESSAASFYCSASGDPKPAFTWYKGDQQLLHGGRIVLTADTLTILNTSPADSGKYSCNVSNGLASHVGTAYLIVHGKYKIHELLYYRSNFTVNRIEIRTIFTKHQYLLEHDSISHLFPFNRSDN